MNRFKNILFFADGVIENGPALVRAIYLAERNQARLTVLDVVEPIGMGDLLAGPASVDLTQLLLDQRDKELNTLVAQFQLSGAGIRVVVSRGKPFDEVLRTVVRGDHDLLIKAARPPAIGSERLFGSTDMHLLRKCPCPVWIDRPKAQKKYRNILAAIDVESGEHRDAARVVLDLASSLAQQESAQLHVVHAWQLYGESTMRSGRASILGRELELLSSEVEKRHREALYAVLEAHRIDPHTSAVHLVKGEPATVIHQLSISLNVDLVVMSTIGRTGIPGLIIGNTAEEVLNATRASVLAVKPPAFESPFRIAD